MSEYKGLLAHSHLKALKTFVGLITDGLLKDDGTIIATLEDEQNRGKL